MSLDDEHAVIRAAAERRAAAGVEGRVADLEFHAKDQEQRIKALEASLAAVKDFVGKALEANLQNAELIARLARSDGDLDCRVMELHRRTEELMDGHVRTMKRMLALVDLVDVLAREAGQ